MQPRMQVQSCVNAAAAQYCIHAAAFSKICNSDFGGGNLPWRHEKWKVRKAHIRRRNLSVVSDFLNCILFTHCTCFSFCRRPLLVTDLPLNNAVSLPPLPQGGAVRWRFQRKFPFFFSGNFADVKATSATRWRTKRVSNLVCLLCVVTDARMRAELYGFYGY